MIIIEKPYASEYFIDTIVQNDWHVLYNNVVKEANIEEGAFNLLSSENAKRYYESQEFPMIYSNAESSISWILENIPNTNLASYIRFFKDKVEFRNMLQTLYPNFYFQSIPASELKSTNSNLLKFPLVIKPSIGFLSSGVHIVNNKDEWQETVNQIGTEMKKVSEMFPNNVVNASTFIIEQEIIGEEYAVDAYYDRDGEPVILNIFQHPFNNSKDVSDRIYLLSTEIMIKYMAKFVVLLKQIGELKNIRNFPFHIELRVTNEGEIIPIEVNPMRFAGWCTAEIAKYAWGLNVYECFHNQEKPNWNEILSNAGKETYYFSMVEVPYDINRNERLNFDYNGFLANYSNILEVRRINFRENPLFAIIFGSLTDKREINRILNLKIKDYII